ELGGTLPFARVAKAESDDIKQALDAGAKGLIFPMIESKSQLEHAVGAAFYPPRGHRGVGYARANLFGKNFEKNISEASDLVIVAQIEHIKALKELDEILSVPDLDGIMVGPYDLSASMDLTAQFEHQDFIKAMNEISQKAKSHEIPMGSHVVQPDQELLEKRIQEGHQFIAYSIDAVFLYQSAECPNKDSQ
ncbi:MAG: 2,4-dihydroxyhept-2-ene-1,7-dioic acid aldolase, partial [Proteobacteria bacterium]|nr:2,4-dihydroxyhept-2-ene-1,7-dioic acid aldolase [Pseudomonadota bacterium]